MDKIITVRTNRKQHKRWEKLGKKIGRKRSKEMRDLLGKLFDKFGV